jgi:cell division protein FtsB
VRARAGHRRDRRGPRTGRWLAALALSLGGLVLAAAFVGITVQGNAIAREIAGYHADISAAQAEQAARRAHIGEQQTPDYVREKARDYGYIGPNESLIAVERSGQTSDPSMRAAPASFSRIARWITFFFGSR